MKTDPDCIFCKIIAGDIPSLKIYEDAETYAFMDINPANEGHALAIPKNHAPDVYEIAPEDIAATMRTAQKVARALKTELDLDGLTIVQANGPGAKQSVMHFHIHILPRRMDDNLMMNWPLAPGDMDAIGALADRLKVRLSG